MEDKDNPVLVSIITVCFNSADTLKDTLESVLNQTYSNIEYIVIDGDSKDETCTIIESYSDKFLKKGITFQWNSEPDDGIYDAYNKGLALVKGDLIGILNSDDWYSNDAIGEVVSTYNYKPFSIISGERNKVRFDKSVYGVRYNKKDVGRYIHKTMPLNFPATFIHSSVYKKIGLYNTKYILSADYDLIYRAYRSEVNFLFTDKIIVNMRNSGATGQLKNLWVTAKEDFDIRKENKVRGALFYYIKRMGFNCLIIFRDTMKTKLNR